MEREIINTSEPLVSNEVLSEFKTNKVDKLPEEMKSNVSAVKSTFAGNPEIVVFVSALHEDAIRKKLPKKFKGVVVRVQVEDHGV